METLSSEENPLSLDRRNMRDCSIYKQMPDGTFYPCFWNDVSRCRSTTYLVIQYADEGKICLMTKEAVRKLKKQEDDYNAEQEKNSPYRFFRK